MKISEETASSEHFQEDTALLFLAVSPYPQTDTTYLLQNLNSAPK